MLTIVKITKAKGRFYQVDLSNQEQLLVSEDLLVSYRLLKGLEITEKDFEELKEASQIDVAYQKVLSYLSYQLRTKKDIRQYLNKLELSAAQSLQIIKKLEELKLLDDLVYAESYVRTQVRLGDKGPKNLAQQLKEKGIAIEDIEKALQQFPDTEQLEIGKKTAEKIQRRQQNKSRRDQLQKIRLGLMQKGFEQSVIEEVLQQFSTEPDAEEEWENLVKQGEKLWQKNQRFEKSKQRLKVKQSLYQKGFSLDLIQEFLTNRAEQDDE